MQKNSFSLYFSVNTLFFTDSSLHKIYENKGVFDFLYELPKIFYSSIISIIFSVIVKKLSLTESQILDIKKENRKEKLPQIFAKALTCFLIKFIIFFIINFVFLLIFWYYLSCFCAVYKNTQSHLIADTIISFMLSLLYPLGFYLIPAFLRTYSLEKGNRKCTYQISKILQFL